MSEDSTVFDESVSELVDAIRAGEIPLGNLLDAYLDRIKENDRLINAYVTVTEDLARELADTAQRMIESGEELGPLHGIPIALDDNGYLRNGVPQTFGSPVFADMDFVAPRTEVVTARLETAGAIILGKTNLAEFGHKAMTDNNFAGATANPFDTSKNAGGHSGGAAAAVAAGMAPAAAGSDGGGSIRVPAASCGIYGLKPSPGLIPFDSRTDAFGTRTHYNVMGPLTRTVDDAALLMEVMAGYHPGYARSVPVEIDYRGATDRSITGLQVAYSPDLDGFDIDDEVGELVKNGLDGFESAGATVEAVSIDTEYDVEELADAAELGWAAEVAAGVAKIKETSDIDVLAHSGTAESLWMWLDIADGVSYTDVALTGLRRTRWFHAVQAIFEKYDLLVTPTLGRVGIDLHQEAEEHLEWLRTSVLTWPFNLTGHPAATVPVGLTASGLPVGMQIVGRRYEDDTVLAASAGIERERPWNDIYSSLALAS